MLVVPPNPGDPYLSGPLPPEPDDFQVAVTAVTRAIRAINNGSRPGDGAELITQLVVAAAANLGSSHALTQARPGSWEAAKVRDLLASTVGEGDEYLLTHRTEPVGLVVNSTYELDDLGLYENYEASSDHIGSVLFRDRWTPSRDRLTLDELEQIEDIEAALAELEDADRAEYERRFTATVANELDNLRASTSGYLPAHLTVNVRFVNHRDDLTDGWQLGLASDLYLHAREHTSLPGSDTAPDWSKPTPASALLDGGHWPHLRIAALAHYGIPTTRKD